MGQLRQSGPKDSAPLVLAQEPIATHTISQANLSTRIVPVRKNDTAIEKSTSVNTNIDKDTHDALLLLITELEELLEDE